MEKALDFRTDLSSPVIIVTRATYGEMEGGSGGGGSGGGGFDSSKLIDVTSDLQRLVVGKSLCIETGVDLNRLFQFDPSPGKRKQLHIAYMTKGFTGNLRVREKQDLLVAGIELGYPPVNPPDDDDFIVN
ncbi:hypothetical protein B484DRAFT_460406 [Ochromonadaceae sp. CCMP2298]|nr:hypothetical protein B484DRAFT_460406 [Ochromonadaceae sp. CCMP2298]